MYDNYRQRSQYADVRQDGRGRDGQQWRGERYENGTMADSHYSRGGEWPTGYRGGEQGGDFWDVLREAAHGRRPIPEELKIVIEEVVREQTERMLAGQGYYPAAGGNEHGGELHHRYKEVLEKLREIPSAMEAVKQFGKYFDDLSEEERKVLTQLIQRPTIKKQAAAAGVSPERFMQLKHELQYKLKEQ
jgi:hypothetical protein